MTAFRSSGDLAADRRFLWADASRAEGDWAAAADLFSQAVELAPGWAAGWHACGEALARVGRTAEASAAFRRCLMLEPQDGLGAGLALARLEGQAVTAMPADFVAGLFDGYARSFDRHLTQALAYRGPQIIVAALATVRQPLAFGAVLDLGCGTGLLAQALAGTAEVIDGVDLSPGMLEVAHDKGLYRDLAAGDVTAHLEGLPADRRYDLIAAADVLVYIGDLGPLFAASTRGLAPGGLFAATVQARQEEGYGLGADMRFHHSARYLRDTAAAAGLEVRHLAEAVTRTDAGRDVPGLVVVLARATG